MKSAFVSLLSLAMLLAMPLFVAAAEVDLKVGDAAPAFSAKDDADKAWKSSDYIGKGIVVVYFYPADLTGGCTKQACGFRDDLAQLKEKGVTVVGVSGDSVANHQIFKQAHNLNFTLLADPDGAVAGALGVPFTKGEKVAKVKVDDKELSLTRGGTASRWTLVFDKQGKLAMKNTTVKAAEDSQAILKLVESLK